MPSDSEGKKAPPFLLLNRTTQPERRRSPLNPYYGKGSHKRSTSGSLPPGLLRLMRADDNEEDSDGAPSLLLPSIDVHKVSYSESDSDANSKLHSPTSSRAIHSTPPRLWRIKESESDATTLNDISRFRIIRPPNDQIKNRDLFHSTCSLPELPKWLDKVNDGYQSEGYETKRKSAGASFRKEFKLSDVFSDMFLASENRAFDAIISTSRHAKCFYWKKRKPDRWIKFQRSEKKTDRPFHPFRVQNRYSNLLDSHSLVNSPSCASPINDPTEEDYEAADDASITSTDEGGLDHATDSFSNRLVGLNLPVFKETKSRTSTNNSNFRQMYSEGEFWMDRSSSFKKSLVDAKNLCDSQLGMVHAEIVAVLNDENDVGPGIVLIRKYLDDESTSILKELSVFIQRILSFSYEELLLPNTIQRIIEELQIIQLKLSEKRNGATGWFGIQTSMAISGVLNIIEHAQDETSIFAKGADESESESYTNAKVDFGLNMEPEFSQDDRILCRPSFGQISNVSGIKQNDWTYNELQDVAEEGRLLNIVIVSLKSGEISFISPSVDSVFGFDSDVIIGTNELPFLPKETSGYRIFQTAVQKLFEMDDVFIEVIFKARRSDGLAILMEATGMRLDGTDGSVWIAKPVALLGRQWKDYGDEERVGPSGQNISTDCSPELSKCLFLGGSNESLNADLALCHICDRTIPAIIFENHNVVCTNAHRAEMEIIVIQDSLENIRTQLVNQDTFLQEEVQMELLEKENDPEVLQDQKLYIDCLTKLSSLSRYMMDKVDSLLLLTVQEIEIAKQRVYNEELDPVNELVDWTMPQHSAFFPSTDIQFCTQGMEIFKEQLLSMGNNLWTIACAFGASIPSFKIKIEFLRDSTHFYQLSFMQEENLKFEIGLKADDSLNSVKIDCDISLANLNLEKQTSKEKVERNSSAPIMVSPQLSERKKISRLSRIVIDTEKVLPVQKSDFPTSPFMESAKLRNSPISGSSSSRSQPSIKEYSIVKPISKGAYGSVFLAQKKMTGDYYAIKVLKKADMIAKNQVTNVRAERLILTQLDSPYVVRLYYSFQSKNHLYLVMEYLNGGDCASLLKAVGTLDEKWARQYVSEMVLGLEFLHSKGVVHRDMKPDNLLIDSAGHIRITDFGLSRMGFIAQRALHISNKQPIQTSPTDFMTAKAATKFLLDSSIISSEPTFMDTKIRNFDLKRKSNSHQLLSVSPISPLGQFVFPKTHHRRDSIASVASTKSFCSNTDTSSPEERGEVRNHFNIFLGTPDYVAPESIMGEYQDAPVDWWAVGIILYEFLFGYPPFNADTAQKVFENILHKNMKWHDEEMNLGPHSRNLMESFLEMDPKNRLGCNGADEIKSHLWFDGVDWNNLNLQEAQFVPQIQDEIDTEYFDDRGAKDQTFEDEDTEEGNSVDQMNKERLHFLNNEISELRGSVVNRKKGSDFGGFMYRNLPLLEKANQKLVQKLKSGLIGEKSRSMLKLRQTSAHIRKSSSSLSRTGFESESEALDMNPNAPMRRSRQSSVPLGRKSNAVAKRSSMSPYATFAVTKSSQIPNSPRLDSDLKTLDVLIADSNYAILGDFLEKLGCRIIQATSGPEALALARFDIKFDAIFLDSRLSIVSCENVCRFVKTVSNLNQHSPVICMTSFQHTYEQIQEFDDVLSKPISFDILKHIIAAIRAEPASVRGFTF